jgi:5'-methylthioadenosine phosphorylase
MMFRPEQRQGIIAGTGFSEKASEFEIIQTDYGDVRIGHLELGGRDTIFLARHQQLQIPSHVNYRANVEALKLLGVNRVFTVSAAGRMHQDVLPGHLVNVSDLVWDHTGNREVTFAENEGLILHASLAGLYSQGLRNAINQSWTQAKPAVERLYQDIPGLSVGFHEDGTYFNSEPPWFNTEAREAWLRNTVPNIKLIGQTAIPETPLLRELGIPQATIAMCTDHSTYPGAVRVSHAGEGGVIDVARTTSLAALAVLDSAIKLIPDDYIDEMVKTMFRDSVDTNQVNIIKLKMQRPRLALIIQGVLSSK